MTSSLPNGGGWAERAPRATCEEAQQAFVEGGTNGLPSRLRHHMDGCEECAFLRGLSRRFAGSGTLDGASGPLSPFVEVLAHAARTGEGILSRYRIKELVGSG